MRTIGTIILWRTDNRLNSEKDLGQFTLPEPRKDYPVNYVLDGQQRITSLFSVFPTDLTANSGEWREIDMTSYELQTSTQYAIVVRATSGDIDNNVYWRLDQTSPTYTGGARSYSADSGSSWNL